MANTNIDTTSLTAIITEFRRLQAKDSITPEALGSILQRIADLLATAGTSDIQQALNNWYNAMRQAVPYISALVQANFDRNNVLLNPTLVDPIEGESYVGNVPITIQPATTEKAGAMKAQQVTDLNTLRNRYNDTVLPALERLEASIASLLGNTNDLGALSAKGQIAVEIVDGELRVYGSGQLAQAGYVPYLFRHTRKRNRDKIHTDGNGGYTYGPVSKGWHLFGSRHSVQVNGTVAKFSTNESVSFHKQAQGYTTVPEALVHPHIHSNGKITLPWGRSSIRLYDYRAHQNRMVRLRFAIGYAKPVDHGRGKVNVLNLVSNLAEFSVVYNPRANTFTLSR